MTNICAAIGLAQLNNANQILNLKKSIFDKYKKKLSNHDVAFQRNEKSCKNSYWMVSILLRDEDTRDIVRKEMFKNKIETRPLFPLINTMPMFKNRKKYEVANSISKRGINIPSFPALKESDIEHICNTIIDSI